MQKFNNQTSIATPLDRANVDTDAIIPKQFLKSIKRTGFGVNLFDQWRYMDIGEIGMDNSKRPLNKDFVLNNPQYSGSTILLARDNFGCGSSREHAPWALEDYGFRVIIAPSFADIFYNNCFKNGLLPIVQPHKIMDKLFAFDGKISIDLAKQTIDADKIYTFEIDAQRKNHLLNGLDDIAITLQYTDKIKLFELDYFKQHNWL